MAAQWEHSAADVRAEAVRVRRGANLGWSGPAARAYERALVERGRSLESAAARMSEVARDLRRLAHLEEAA